MKIIIQTIDGPNIVACVVRDRAAPGEIGLAEVGEAVEPLTEQHEVLYRAVVTVPMNELVAALTSGSPKREVMLEQLLVNYDINFNPATLARWEREQLERERVAALTAEVAFPLELRPSGKALDVAVVAAMSAMEAAQWVS